MKNRIGYDEFWPILNAEQFQNGEPLVFGVQPSALSVYNRLRRVADQQMKEMEESVTREKVEKLFGGKVSIPVVLLFLQVTFSTGQLALPSIYHLLWPLTYRDVDPDNTKVF
jgi:hypothetical protein